MAVGPERKNEIVCMIDSGGQMSEGQAPDTQDDARQEMNAWRASEVYKELIKVLKKPSRPMGRGPVMVTVRRPITFHALLDIVQGARMCTNNTYDH